MHVQFFFFFWGGGGGYLNLLLCFAVLVVVAVAEGSLSDGDGDGDGDENGKKAIGLNWQTNNFARASYFLVHFFAVVACIRRKLPISRSA